jgi:hypothetical protein
LKRVGESQFTRFRNQLRNQCGQEILFSFTVDAVFIGQGGIGGDQAMKRAAVVLGIILLAATVGAQSNLSDPQPPAAPATAAVATLPSEPAPALKLFADASPNGAIDAPAAVSAVGDPGAAQGPVLSVRPSYYWQLYAGYTLFHFYEVPTLQNLENGFDVAMTYFPKNGWIGAEGDLMATFGSQAGCISKFTFASGGARFRWAGPQRTQWWLHGLVGGAHFFPQTSYGGQNALGYEMGGGVDISGQNQRIAYRFEADAVGTRFFNTYQFSPKFSAGIVFRF